MNQFLLLIALSFISILAQARVEVLFHPHDPTLEKISSWIESGNTVDIAMYNMDVTNKSPVIQTLSSSFTQRRLKNGDLKIRVLFEGYGTLAENSEKMQALEDLGLDVRYYGRSIKIHHKFATIDSGTANERVISGSANWSLSSYQNYNENILFFSNEPEISARFQTEFDRLWTESDEFGQSHSSETQRPLSSENQNDIQVFFNSPRSLRQQDLEETNLTAEVVRTINATQLELVIATTRARLIPVLEALQEAANRGVKIYLLLNQDDYHDLGKRSGYLFSNPNIQVRLKFFNLDLSEYLAFQMHNKFLISDRTTLLSGSFNWSKSSENNHIENLIKITGETAQQVVPSYLTEFYDLWDLGRDQYNSVKSSLEQGSWRSCGIPQMSLSTSEIKSLLLLARNCR